MKKIKVVLTEQEVRYLLKVIKFTDLCSIEVFDLYLMNNEYKRIFDSIFEKLTGEKYDK